MSSSKHPNEGILALYAGGDLDFVERMRVALHVRGCEVCGERVEHFKVIRAGFKSAAERTSDPLGDWDRLSDEMTANIRLGISMAECVGPGRQERHHSRFEGFFWRPPVMATGALVLFTAAFAINMPVGSIWNRLTMRDQSGLVLASTAAGIEVRRDGRAVISVLHPDSKPSQTVAVNLDGSMSANYVDDDTGQVTITNVAGQ